MSTNSADTSMPLRPYGKTGLHVTPLCIGGAPLGDMPETFAYSVSDEQALATIRAVFESTINFLDTAASYGDGEGERRIGLVLRERGGLPPGFVLATKADRDLKTSDFSGDQMRRSVERSLKLLGLDRLQICYLHDPEHGSFEALTAPGGALDALVRLRDEGVIQHLGLAGGPIDLSMRYIETGVFESVISHNRYTLLNRSASPLFDLALKRGMAAVNAAPYGSGILAKGPLNYPRYAYQDAPAELLGHALQMEQACQRFDVPLGAAALQFSMRDPRIVSTIVGISKPERIHQTVEWAHHPIPEALWAELDSIGPVPGDPEEHRWA